MRILILGGGAVGSLLAQRLIREKNEVVIVEEDSERCIELEETLDAKIVQGHAGSIHTLQKAGMADVEMLIAVTNNDEANILACLIAEALSNVEIKLVRLRTHEVDEWKSICGSQMLNVDLVIHPHRGDRRPNPEGPGPAGSLRKIGVRRRQDPAHRDEH